MIFTIIKDLAVKIELHKRLVRTLSAFVCDTSSRKRGRFEVYQLMLGHESITTEIYLHLDRKFLTEVINTFHPRKNP
jgi:integrase/recombinase XerD